MSPSASTRADGWRQAARRLGATAQPLTTVPLVVIGVSAWSGLLDHVPAGLRVAVSLLALAILPIWIAALLLVRVRLPEPPTPYPIRSPVRGRWMIMNGPGTRVPSHGTHLFAQTYAVDLVHEPAPGSRPRFGGRHPARRPERYRAFGRPVLAPIAGRVIAVRGSGRDHLARSNLLGYLYMVLESVVLSLRGATGVMGNHVILRADDGTCVAIAHLQRGSPAVEVGDLVVAGQVLGAVGNSGNSSEPHVHLQVMDRPRPSRALGLPFTLTDAVVSDAVAPPTEAAPGVAHLEDGTFLHGGIVSRREAG